MMKDKDNKDIVESFLKDVPIYYARGAVNGAVIEDGVVTNIIVSEPSKMKNFNAIICPDDMSIGDFYDEETKKFKKKPDPEIEKQLKEELDSITLLPSQLRIAVKRAGKYNKLMDELKKETNDEYEIMWEYNSSFFKGGPFLQWFKNKFYRSEKKFDEFLLEAEKIRVG